MIPRQHCASSLARFTPDELCSLVVELVRGFRSWRVLKIVYSSSLFPVTSENDSSAKLWRISVLLFYRRPYIGEVTMGCKSVIRVAVMMAAAIFIQSASIAAEQTHLFNVLNHRTVSLTAQYWNPILIYVTKKTGVPLELRLNKTSKENTAVAETGAYDFLYTNHFFTPERDRLGYRVIARPAGPGIKSQIVVNQDSPARSLRDLEGKTVAFPTPDGFTGYWLPMDALLKSKVTVNPVFSGNQEASFAQLKIGAVEAAGVNSLALQIYARREGFEYRVLWTSELYNDLCIMANPRVPAEKVAAVKAALINMADDLEGLKILQAGADLLKIKGELGFVASNNRDYDNYRAFYKTTLVKNLNKE
jgi:phosphonate transport system substrate-binding protein